MRPPHRLIVCLDGTWNKRDDTTNVFHHSTLALEGLQADGWVQRKYYDEGVGTGVLDGISGGAFGFGLEQNVREAYNWLVEHWHEGDEVYVFGFSRGAFTARSLVGFIASCGLLKRGAPLAVTQLWQNYGLLGRQREGRRSWLERLAEERPTARRLNQLMRDPWTRPPKDDPPRPPGLPGQRCTLYPSELLLVAWSRRIRIRYLGLYDTVGAMGIDALAIPGLRGRLALHHNLQPTSIIQRCRHALAIDEHRSSFAQTALTQYLGHAQREGQSWAQQTAMWQRVIRQRWFAGAHSNIGGGYPDNALAHLPLRWVMAGAIKAGLVCQPLEYARGEPLPKPRDSYLEFARPFWADIFRGKRWYRELDPEREYRAAPPGMRAALTDGAFAGFVEGGEAETVPAGFSLKSINEDVDHSVLDACLARQYEAPNVVAYARRRVAAVEATACAREQGAAKLRAEALTQLEEAGRLPAAESDRQERLRKRAEQRQWRSERMLFVAQDLRAKAVKLRTIGALQPQYDWLGTRTLGYALLVLWAVIGALGLHAFAALLQRDPFVSLQQPVWLAPLAVALVLIDWREGHAVFGRALHPEDPRRRAQADALYWLRMLGFLLFVAGLVWAGVSLMHAGSLWWQERLEARELLLQTTQRYGYAAVAAAGTVALIGVLARGPRRTSVLSGATLGLGFTALCIVLTLAAGGLLTVVFPAWLQALTAPPPPLVQTGQFGADHTGLLLPVMLALAALVNSLKWVSNPLARGNLGRFAVLRLQLLCATPAQVMRLLERWQQQLACRWDPADLDPHRGPAARALLSRLRESLWRDVLGFIPLVMLVSAFGLWFCGLLVAHVQALAVLQAMPAWQWLTSAEGIAVVVGLAAVADWCEDASHFRYLRGFVDGLAPPAPLVAGAWLCSWVKTLLSGAALLLTALALLLGLWEVARAGAAAGWLGSVSLAISLLVGLRFAVPFVLALGYRLLQSRA